jgi:hypothetical protein
MRNPRGIFRILLLMFALASLEVVPVARATPQGSGALPERPLPRGFQPFSDPSGSGRLLVFKMPAGTSSGRAVMRDGLAALKGYFDAPPQLLAAVSDPQDRAVQVLLSANLQGQRVQGVATAVAAPSGVAFGLIFDRPQLLRSSFQPLSARLAQEMPATNAPAGGSFSLAPPGEWKRQSGGDRSAAVDLPPGWQISSVSQGIVTVTGPHNELIQLGLTFLWERCPAPRG